RVPRELRHEQPSGIMFGRTVAALYRSLIVGHRLFTLPCGAVLLLTTNGSLLEFGRLRHAASYLVRDVRMRAAGQDRRPRRRRSRVTCGSTANWRRCARNSARLPGGARSAA